MPKGLGSEICMGKSKPTDKGKKNYGNISEGTGREKEKNLKLLENCPPATLALKAL